jgi:hypothetical protein
MNAGSGQGTKRLPLESPQFGSCWTMSRDIDTWEKYSKILFTPLVLDWVTGSEIFFPHKMQIATLISVHTGKIGSRRCIKTHTEENSIRVTEQNCFIVV